MREISVVEIGKLPNVKRVRHAKNTTVDDVTDLRTSQPVCIKKKSQAEYLRVGMAII
jgi:hypothetical protein